MREDMAKVLIERPRYGSSDPSKKTGLRIRRYDPEDKDKYDNLPQKLPASRGTKYFTDLLGPLRRYLRSNVGRPWDKVYSEMKQHLDDRKVTGRHVFEHVLMEVELHTYTGEDGRIYKRPRWGKPRPVEGLYVHPRTGLLCWKEPRSSRQERKARSAQAEVTRVPISKTRSYLKLDGIWYIADLGEDDPPADGAAKEVYQEGHRRWQILRKKQCNRKELKTAGLTNSHPAD